MARFVYIDETGTAGNQPYLHVVAAVVDEDQVQPLAVEVFPRSYDARHGLRLPPGALRRRMVTSSDPLLSP